MNRLTIQFTKLPETKKKNSPLLIRKTKSSHLMKYPAARILFLQRTIGNQAIERLFNSGVIQVKLKIGQLNDIYEQEANRVADRVMTMPEQVIYRQMLINAHQGSSEASPQSEQAFFESRLYADFSRLRVHKDKLTDEIAHTVSTRAFSVGRDIVFGAKQYITGTATRRKLPAHEFTHGVLQGKYTADNVSNQQPIQYENKLISTRCQPRIQMTTLRTQDVLWQTGLYPCSELVGRAVAEFNSRGDRCQSYQAQGGNSYGATPSEAVIWPDAANQCLPGSCGCVRPDGTSGSINIPANFCSSSCAFWLRPGDPSSASVSDALCVLAHEISHIWHLPLSDVPGYLSQCTGSDICFRRFHPDFPTHPPPRPATEELIERPVGPRHSR